MLLELPIEFFPQFVCISCYPRVRTIEFESIGYKDLPIVVEFSYLGVFALLERFDDVVDTNGAVDNGVVIGVDRPIGLLEE